MRALVDGYERFGPIFTLRIFHHNAMRALFGPDPDQAEPSRQLRRPVLPGGRSVAHEFETALSFHARGIAGPVARGPGSPYARVLRSRRRLDELLFSEIDRRRAGEGLGEDLLSLLIVARDDDGDPLPREQIRDAVMTLLFAGHDTTTSMIAFLFYERARFTTERKAALPRGAYIPFGGGSRLELAPGYELSIRHAPTISPRGGMPVKIRAL